MSRRIFPARVTLSLWLAFSIFLFPRVVRAAFEDMGAGARAPGLGGAFTALADDLYAVYYNPAGLPQVERPQAAASYARLYMGLSDGSDLGVSQLTYAHPLKRGRWGVMGGAYQRFALNDIYEESSLYLAWGRPVWQRESGAKLLAGVTTKYLSHSFKQLPEAFNACSGLLCNQGVDPALTAATSKGAIDADIGLLYRMPKRLQFGLAAQHVMRPDVGFAGSDKLPMNLRLGAAYRSLWMSLLGEVQMDGNPQGGRDRNMILAAERFFPTLDYGQFGLRGSVGFGSRDWRQITLGFSYRINKIQIDYGFLMPMGTIQETAGTHRASLTFHFGVPTAEEEISRELFEQALIARSGKMPYLDAQRPHDLNDPKLERVLRETQGGRFRMAHYSLTQLGSEEVPPDPSMVRLSNRLGLVASFYPDIDMTDLGERWQVALSSGVQNFLFGQDSTALLQTSYASSLKPADVKLANFLGKMEEYAGLKADRVPAEADRNLAQEFVFRAEAANNRGERDKVLTYLRDALFLEPNNTVALERIGSTYYVLGQYRLAIAVWQRAMLLELNAKEREVLGYYIEDSRRKLDGGAPPPDLSTLQEEQKPEPEAPKPSAAPRPAPAPAKIRVGDPRDIPALYQKGVEHYARGEYLQATAMFMRILRIDPENIQAKKALERIQRMNQQR